MNDEDSETCAYRDAVTVHDLTPTELISFWRRLRRLQPLDSQCSGVDLENSDDE